MTTHLNRILQFAQDTDEVSFVIQNGSRVNPTVTPDKYADYDIVFGCQHFERFLNDRTWISLFGELLILQWNMVELDGVRWPIFLMQFQDGFRLDLQFCPRDGNAVYRSDSLSKVLLDKNHQIAPLTEPSEEGYLVKAPSAKEYTDALNEFWWCILYVGKGIARHELTYARFVYESTVRECFLKIVGWYAGSRGGWRVNPGKHGKFLSKYLEPEFWRKLEATYLTDTDAEFWSSIFAGCALVSEVNALLRPVLAPGSQGEDEDALVEFLGRVRDDLIEEAV